MVLRSSQSPSPHTLSCGTGRCCRRRQTFSYTLNVTANSYPLLFYFILHSEYCFLKNTCDYNWQRARPCLFFLLIFFFSKLRTSHTSQELTLPASLNNLKTCIYLVCARAMACMRGSEDNSVTSIFSLYLCEILGVDLQSPVLHSKHLVPLNHLIHQHPGPPF